MELKWLEDFLTVAGTGNFSRAAEVRNVTQPAFSRRLRALEIWAGVSLLDRSSYPITLTPAGAKFLPVAEQVVREIKLAREQARNDPGPASTMLKLAMPHSLAAGFFPTWWPKVTCEVDNLTTKLVADNLHDCVELLVQGGCQFLLCYRNSAVPNPMPVGFFRGKEVGRDKLVAVTGTNPDGSARHRLSLDPASATHYLAYSPDSFLGKVTASLIRQSPHRLNLKLTYESAFVEAVRAQTLSGAGIAWLPMKLIAGDIMDGRLALVDGTLPEMELEIWLYCPPQNQNPVIDRIWDAALDKGEAEPRPA